MRKPEAIAIVRTEAHVWFAEVGRPADPSFSDFAGWLEYRHPAIFSFKSVMGARDDIERVWASELRQSWRLSILGGVDKFEPVSGSGDMDHAEEAIGQLVVSGGDRSVDRPRFSGSMGSKAFRMRHSASVRSPRLKPASKKQP